MPEVENYCCKQMLNDKASMDIAQNDTTNFQTWIRILSLLFSFFVHDQTLFHSSFHLFIYLLPIFTTIVQTFTSYNHIIKRSFCLLVLSLLQLTIHADARLKL